MLTDVVAGQTVLNSACVWDDLKHFPGLRFHILIDGPNVAEFRRALPSFVEVKAVPRSFRPTHARYKARVLEYFRRQQELTEDDWVLHLDEESELDEYAIKTCLDFIERGTEHVGIVRPPRVLHNAE